MQTLRIYWHLFMQEQTAREETPQTTITSSTWKEDSWGKNLRKWENFTTSLLLRRTGPRGDPVFFDFEGYLHKKWRAIQTDVDWFWKKWNQLAWPNQFVRLLRTVTWPLEMLSDCQFRLAKVVDVNSDKKGTLRDVQLSSFPNYPVSTVKPTPKAKKHSTKIPATILHRDVRRIVVLLPVEEQQQNKKWSPIQHRTRVTSLGWRTRGLSGRCFVKTKITFTRYTDAFQSYSLSILSGSTPNLQKVTSQKSWWNLEFQEGGSLCPYSHVHPWEENGMKSLEGAQLALSPLLKRKFELLIIQKAQLVGQNKFECGEVVLLCEFGRVCIWKLCAV